jgi:hypothetical protein
VHNRDEIVDVLHILGHKKTTEYENISDKYCYGTTKISANHYPGLPPVIELNAVTDTELRTTEERLGLNRHEPQYTVRELYERYYGIPTVTDIPAIVFISAAQGLGKYITTSHEGFHDILTRQLETLRDVSGEQL